MRIRPLLVTGIAAGSAAYAYGQQWQTALACAVAAPAVLRIGPHFVAGHVARIARSCGVPVIMTSLTGDWGVDLIVGRRPNRLAIQCKRQARPVGTGAVQEVVAGAPMQDCTRTMVVTNHEFTPAARKLAELHGCTLVGGAELPRLRSTIRALLAQG